MSGEDLVSGTIKIKTFNKRVRREMKTERKGSNKDGKTKIFTDVNGRLTNFL